jgi:hypothetical protein
VKIYVAGSSNELDRLERFMDAFEAAGHEITLRWTALVRAAAAEGFTSDTQIPVHKAVVDARADLDAIDRCDCFVLVVPEPPSRGRGAWVELGYALRPGANGASPWVIVIGQHARISIFTSRADYCIVEPDEQALPIVLPLLTEIAEGFAGADIGADVTTRRL